MEMGVRQDNRAGVVPRDVVYSREAGVVRTEEQQASVRENIVNETRRRRLAAS